MMVLLFVDELNVKLHPLLFEVYYFLFVLSYKSKAQLIYTTDDYNVDYYKFFRWIEITLSKSMSLDILNVALSDFK